MADKTVTIIRERRRTYDCKYLSSFSLSSQQTVWYEISIRSTANDRPPKGSPSYLKNCCCSRRTLLRRWEIHRIVCKHPFKKTKKKYQWRWVLLSMEEWLSGRVSGL